MKNRNLIFASILALSSAALCGNAYAADGYPEGKTLSESLAEWERRLDLRSGRIPAEQRRASRENYRADRPSHLSDKSGVGSGWKFGASVEGFYAVAMREFWKDVDEPANKKLDVAGVNFRFSATPGESLFDAADIVPEFFGIVGVGVGEESYTYYDWYDKYEYRAVVGQLSVGANLRWRLCDEFSLFGGARLGLSYVSVRFENEYEDVDYIDSYSMTEDGIGFLCGVGVGGELHFSENHSLSVAVDYLLSTATAEFDWGEGDKAETKQQQYCVFSVGYKYTF